MSENYKKIISDKKIQAERLMNMNQITKCNLVIHTAAVESAAAGAIPIPVADAIPITVMQVTMVIALGKIFDVKLTESAAKGLIGAAASTFVGRSIVKMIPFIGWGISAVVAAGVTEAIGWTIAVDFARDAKNRWEQKHKSAEKSDTNFEDSIVKESETDTSEDFKDNLYKRAEPFLSGEKKRTGHEEELQALQHDIESILDSLPEDHPLVEIYDKLCLIID